MVIGAVGLWLSFTAMSRSRAAAPPSPRRVLAASSARRLSALPLIGFVLFWPQISQYANCMSGANTVARSRPAASS